MGKKIAQYRYYGSDNTKNYPESATYETLHNAFKYPFYQLGIQTLPGVQFRLNNSLDYITVGPSGLYDLDVDGISEITSLKFTTDSFTLIDKSKTGYLIIDTIYEEDD